MPKLTDVLVPLDKWRQKAYTVLKAIPSLPFHAGDHPPVICAAFLMRQLNYADSVKHLMENDLPEAACVVARVMLEGTACLWWIIESDHVEERATSWADHAYREALKIPEELKTTVKETRNVFKIKEDAKELQASGAVFKGYDWTIDETGKKVMKTAIIQEFANSKVTRDFHIPFRYSQLSGFVHWSTASFSIDNSSSDALVFEALSGDYRVSCINSATNSLGVMTKIAEKFFAERYS